MSNGSHVQYSMLTLATHLYCNVNLAVLTSWAPYMLLITYLKN